MRTTVTLDPDAEQAVRRRMAERKTSFKRALNELIRAGEAAGDGPREPFRTRTAPMGPPLVNLDRALQLAGELEDEALMRKLLAGS